MANVARLRTAALIGPLEGLFVVDMTWSAPGSIASMIFADYGATVVKVERPQQRTASLSSSRKVWDRNKLSVVVDLDGDAGREHLHALLRRADVFIESDPSPRLADAGFGADQLAALYPHLVHASITGYGRGGPWSERPGWDALVAAKFGVMAEQDGPRPGPHFLGHPSTLYSTAMLTVIGALAALNARRHTGRGQLVDASLLDGVLALSTMNWWFNERGVSYLARSGKELGFGRSRIITDLFLCGDGEWIVVHTGGTGGFKRTMELLGLGDKIREIPGLETTEPLDDDEYHAARHLAPLAFANRPRSEWLRVFHGADLAALPVLRPTEVLEDEQVVHDRVVIEVDDEELGTLRQVGRCIQFTLTDDAPVRRSPNVGEHDALLGELAAAAAPADESAAADAAPSGAVAEATFVHPLQGIRILDFSTYFAGPYGARLLSDLGADVIKIEASTGDPMRPLPDPFEGAQRGKRTIALDLKSSDGLRIVQQLVRSADVVMHNFRPGTAERLGIAYEQLRPLNERLIYAYLPGFGSSGPKSTLKSFAPLLSGFVGNFFEGAGRGQPPVRRVMGNEDYYNGLSGAMAVLMAIECRNRTGLGQALESAQLKSALFATSHNFVDATGAVHRPFELDEEQFGWSATYRLYRTSDGWLCLAGVGEAAHSRLRAALGFGDAEPVEGAGDGDDGRLAERIGEHLSGLGTDEAFALLDGAGVACEIAIDYPMMPDLLWDEWLLATNRILEQEHPTWGYIREIGELVHLSDTPAARKGTGPLLGEHTIEILAEVGFERADIDRFVASGVCVASTTEQVV